MTRTNRPKSDHFFVATLEAPIAAIKDSVAEQFAAGWSRRSPRPRPAWQNMTTDELRRRHDSDCPVFHLLITYHSVTGDLRCVQDFIAETVTGWSIEEYLDANIIQMHRLDRVTLDVFVSSVKSLSQLLAVGLSPREEAEVMRGWDFRSTSGGHLQRFMSLGIKPVGSLRPGAA